jgi:hypothetical protein
MTVKTKRAASGRNPATKRTPSKVVQRAKVKQRAGADVGTVGKAALRVAKSGARLATYSAKFALAKVEGVWQSAIHSVAERNSKSSAKSR